MPDRTGDINRSLNHIRKLVYKYQLTTLNDEHPNLRMELRHYLGASLHRSNLTIHLLNRSSSELEPAAFLELFRSKGALLSHGLTATCSITSLLLRQARLE